MANIPHSRPSISDKDVEEVSAVLKSGELARGSKVALLESRVSSMHSMAGGVATSSGTSALHIALLGLNVGQGDEVILPSYICASVLDAINYTGAKPVIVDIDETYNLSAQSAQANISKSTAAIVIAHMFGRPADISQFLDFDIPVIEDCAQAIGATYDGQAVGSFGDMSMYSFGPTKVITAGNGGMVLAKNPDYIDSMRRLIDNGNRNEYSLAYSTPFNDVDAALGLSQLDKLPEFVERRREIARFYDEALAEMGIAPILSEGAIAFRYVIQTNQAEEAVPLFKERGIDAELPIYKPLHRYFGRTAEFPNSEFAQNTAVSLPLYPALLDSEIVHIRDTILDLRRNLK